MKIIDKTPPPPQSGHMPANRYKESFILFSKAGMRLAEIRFYENQAMTYTKTSAYMFFNFHEVRETSYGTEAQGVSQRLVCLRSLFKYIGIKQEPIEHSNEGIAEMLLDLGVIAGYFRNEIFVHHHSLHHSYLSTQP